MKRYSVILVRDPVAFPPTLMGTYPPPATRRGRRVWCAYRQTMCLVVGRSDGPIRWPLCRPLEVTGAAGLWMSAELEKAVRTESAAALAYWFGVSARAVGHWRTWAGVGGRTATPGTRQAIREAAELTAKGMREKRFSPGTTHLSGRADTLEPIRRRRASWREWTPEMVARLGREPDEVLAGEWRKSVNAVRVRRCALRIPAFPNGRRR